MYSWGAGSSGQLGTAHLADELAPKAVVWAQERPVPIACGGNHVIAVAGKLLHSTVARSTTSAHISFTLQ